MKKRIAAFAMALVLAAGLCPALASAALASDLHAGGLTVAAQDSADLADCTIRFTDKNHRSDHGDENSTYKVYFVKGKDAVAEPSFDLYLGGTLVPKDAYTVQYQLSWYNDEEGEDALVDVAPAQLTPSRSPEANNENMASEYRIVVTAKDGSGYTGTFQSNEERFVAICVVDWYNVGRYMDCYLAGAKSGWKYNINPMNGNYYVIPQAKAKAALGSLTLRANCSRRWRHAPRRHEGRRQILLGDLLPGQEERRRGQHVARLCSENGQGAEVDADNARLLRHDHQRQKPVLRQRFDPFRHPGQHVRCEGRESR